MAKKEKSFFILKVIGLALCVLTVLSFFFPTVHYKEEKIKDVYYTHAQVCFLSEEKATEKGKEALKAGDEEKALTYSTIADLKDENCDERELVVITAWLHFIAMIVSAIGALSILISFFGKDFQKFGRLAIVISAVFMIATLICSIVFLNKDLTSSSTYGDVLSLSFWGTILGLITSVLASLAVYIPSLTSKRK